MSVAITVSVEGVREQAGRFREGARRFRDLRPAYRVSAGLLRELIGREQFETQGRARGTPWAPLRRATVRSRVKRSGYYRSAPAAAVAILLWTRRLQRSFRDRAAPSHVEIIGTREMLWGSRDPRARFHQSGTRDMARRPILWLTPREQDEVFVRPVELHVLSGLEPGLIRAVAEPRVLAPRSVGGVRRI